MDTRTKPIEVIICWDNHTWTTKIIDIPLNTSELDLQPTAERIVSEYFDAQRNGLPLDIEVAFVGIYSIPEEEE